MPSLLALPSELIAYIVEILVGCCDIESACSLLQSCRSLRLSLDYDRVRYLYLWNKSGFPERNNFPKYIKNDSSLLQAHRWPKVSKRGDDGDDDDDDDDSEKLLHHKWYQVPTSTKWSNAPCHLSKQARLLGDRIYDTSKDGLLLCSFQFTPKHQPNGEENLSEPTIYPMKKSIVSYNVELDEGIIVLLMKGSDTFSLSVRSLLDPTQVIKEFSLEADLEISSSFKEVSVTGKSLLVSLDNQISIYDWKSKPEGEIHRIWSRGSYPANTYTPGGWYIRAHLLSADVVSCIVLWTHRTIGSMRINSGILELYRLDQHNPLVALNKLCESTVDALQPRYLQDPYQYISLQCGGKQALRQYLETGVDQACLIQTFGDVRLGSISALADVIHPRAALTLFNQEHPVLPQEWLRAHFRSVSSAMPLQSSLHGRRMVSCLRGGKLSLLYWSSGQSGQAFEVSIAAAQEDLNPLLAAHRKSDEDVLHIDLVSLDGPRALFTVFRCEAHHNGTMHATEAVSTFWTNFEPSHT